MKPFLKLLLVHLLLAFYLQVGAHNRSLANPQELSNQPALRNSQSILDQRNDSLKSIERQTKIISQTTAVTQDNGVFQRELNDIKHRESTQMARKIARIDSLRNVVRGYPVIGIMRDTLFYIYSKIGSYTPSERASKISSKIKTLYNDDFLNLDSITVVPSENTLDIVYGESIIISISETDALWNKMPIQELAVTYASLIKNDLRVAKEEYSITRRLTRVGLVLLVMILTGIIIWLIGKAYHRLLRIISGNKEKWLKNLSYKDYTYLTAEQEMSALVFISKVFRWILVGLTLYISFPIIFSILLFTRGWAYRLFNLVWLPFKDILLAVWHYLPNLITISVIFFVMKYFIRLLKYLFNEIEAGKLKISGFYADWAMPTYSIVRFILYAFMFVLIFPYLPGSDSNIFKGVSVFIGVLFSFGSSSAIANTVAGLVITYMRPFKQGDRIKVGDITGDVMEKSLLVTRLKSIKNEEITIPNSTLLTGNITNYSSLAKNEGLILNTKVTIGYDVPWVDMHQALIDAALRTKDIEPEPRPFVLQTSLDDFYVTYQINAYTKNANSQIVTYSTLHQNIQDVCNERGIEILSPHYRYQRDGNKTTIPSDYLPNDYQAPNFNVTINKKSKK